MQSHAEPTPHGCTTCVTFFWSTASSQFSLAGRRVFVGDDSGVSGVGRSPPDFLNRASVGRPNMGIRLPWCVDGLGSVGYYPRLIPKFLCLY